MSASIFEDKKVVPTEAMLVAELGNAKLFLDQIQNFIKTEAGDLTLEWKHYGQKSGWVLKMFYKKRNLLFVVPLKNTFHIVFTFGDKAVDAILASDLPEKIKKETASAKKYSEGRSIRLEVSDDETLHHIFDLLKIKLMY